ncbi:MAG TPA: histidine kinase dimerization/phospho-acceptor domain-containing protein [Chloroflexota bacterium]|nr:histidine kinase dimerization/phospho-acceptor domain-containing protein [Chloroflexota bacterium]
MANMAHELRTPLDAIIGHSAMLRQEAEDLNQQSLIPGLQVGRSDRHSRQARRCHSKSDTVDAEASARAAQAGTPIRRIRYPMGTRANASG